MKKLNDDLMDIDIDKVLDSNTWNWQQHLLLIFTGIVSVFIICKLLNRVGLARSVACPPLAR